MLCGVHLSEMWEEIMGMTIPYILVLTRYAHKFETW